MNLSRPEPLHTVLTRTASGSAHIYRPLYVSFTPPAAPPRRRAGQPAAAGHRRPVNRELLDNVDSSTLGGFFSDGFTNATQSSEAAGTDYYPSDVSTAAPQAWDARAPTAGSWQPYDADPSSWPPSYPQAPESNPYHPPDQYDTQGHANGSAAAPLGHPDLPPPSSVSLASPIGNQGISPQTQSSYSEPWPPAPPYSTAPQTGWPGTASRPPPQPQQPAASQSGQPQQPPQQPSQPVQLTPQAQTWPYPRAGPTADWGEPDPLTDWGGGMSGETTGWEDDYEYGGTGMGAGSSSRPDAAATRQASAGARGAAAGMGAAPEHDAARAGGEGTSSSSAATSGSDNDGSSSTDWFDRAGGSTYDGAAGATSADEYWQGDGRGTDTRRFGEPSGAASPYDSYDGWSGVRFTQDARYEGKGGAERWGGGGGEGAAAAGPGPRQQPPPGVLQPSDIVLLSGRDASGVLPLAPTPGQVDYFQPRTLQERIVQYVGSLGVSVILSKAAVLAGPALLYPIWSPWIRAGFRNVDLYSKTFACVGLWRAQVLDVQINGLSIGGMLISKEAPRVSMLVGDPWVGGARVALELPYQIRSESIRPGDSVELLVLSQNDRFTAFKVVREAYLPQSGLWLCDYPFLNRDLFLSISIAIEQSRRGMAASASATLERVDVEADVPYYAYDRPSGPLPEPGLAGPAAGPGATPGAGAGPVDGVKWR